ncbi:MAG: phenylalanine--tRNA ligase subunit beta [Micavibrio aeruginosavorus]|uniref:Phenylalanine--tRNA ligase beta subunit n=1 Tax=Micavibrio aeruginosavorus TaxID=349221 RepID=A0A2W5MXH2_9BACT|nr:MAG: phenylalanine--tRNA ligase subunit beta [Micavibrio aeruginosavorus]
MKFTLGWLKDHLDTNASLDEITEKLTSLGLELEGVEDRAKMFAPFKVAHVVSAEKHPDADRLKVLIVDTGHEKLQVVCGAPNAKAGMKGIFAPDGSFIPGTGTTLKKGNIRGQESNGMMVSEREMGLSDEHNGIIEVDQKYAIGTPFADIYNLNDPVIDISVTPNRADCAGVLGVARDLAAGNVGKLKAQDTSAVKGSFKNPVSVTLEGDTGCPLFLGRYVRGVKNGPAPEAMQARLKAIGLRPISALVDITNYMSIDSCRPLHVFDADKIKGNIVVRSAKKGETLEALNDKTYTLDEGMIVVCDDSGVIGLGGVMGGKSTAVDENTKNVYIECAYFDPYRTAKTGRALEIISDARYRFERGVDPEFTIPAMELATKMVQELCGGEASDVFMAGHVPDWKRSYDFDPTYTEKLSGVEIKPAEQIEILKSLGFIVGGNAASPPSWRGDIQGKADLVEEITRVYGYDKIPALSVRCDGAVSSGAETENFSRSRKARTALASRGLDECLSWSFMNKEIAALFGSNDNPGLTLTNPISSELSQMRPSILPNLIEAAQRNADRGYTNAALYEVGPVFVSSKPDGQKTIAAGVRYAAQGSRHWASADVSRIVDALDAKADALAALEAAGAPVGNLQVSRDAPSYFHPGRSGALRLGANVLAYFGEIHPAVLERMGVKAPVAAFEAFLNNAPAVKKKAKAPLILSAFQPVQRDFAFLVDDKVEAESIIKAARSADKMIETVEIFDVYKGKGVEPGKKSVAINVILQPKEKTLTDAEIEGIAKKIVETVTSKCGAALRG